MYSSALKKMTAQGFEPTTDPNSCRLWALIQVAIHLLIDQWLNMPNTEFSDIAKSSTNEVTHGMHSLKIPK